MRTRSCARSSSPRPPASGTTRSQLGITATLHRDEGGHDGAALRVADVAAEDAAQQRGGELVEDLFAEVAVH